MPSLESLILYDSYLFPIASFSLDYYKVMREPHYKGAIRFSILGKITTETADQLS